MIKIKFTFGCFFSHKPNEQTVRIFIFTTVGIFVLPLVLFAIVYYFPERRSVVLLINLCAKSFIEYWAVEKGQRITIGAVVAVVSINLLLAYFVYVSLTEDNKKKT